MPRSEVSEYANFRVTFRLNPAGNGKAACRSNPLSSSSNIENRPMHSTSSDNSSRSPEAKLFHVEFSDLHVSKEHSVELWCDQLKSQLFEAEYLANEYSCLVPADVSAIVHPSQKKSLRVGKLWQLAWHSYGARMVDTCRDSVVQTLMRALVVEHIAKVVEAGLLRA